MIIIVAIINTTQTGITTANIITVVLSYTIVVVPEEVVAAATDPVKTGILAIFWLLARVLRLDCWLLAVYEP